MTLVSYFIQNLVPGPAVDGVRIALKTFAEDNDKSNLLESLEHIMELMCSKEKAEQEKLEMRKNKIELKALITSMLVERVATLPVATALRRLADQDDPHVMAAYDVYLESDRNKSDLYDTMLRIGQRAVENRAPFHQNSRHQAHDEVLSIVSTLDLSQENRDLLLKCIENGDPTVSSAIQVYVETRDLDEFKEMPPAAAHPPRMRNGLLAVVHQADTEHATVPHEAVPVEQEEGGREEPHPIDQHWDR